MTLVRWNPIVEMEGIRRDLDRMFDASFGNDASKHAAPTLLQLWETGEAYIVRVAVPGVSADNLAIEATPNGLIVSGKTGFSAPEGARLRHAEFGEGEFRRAVKFGTQVKTENVSAKCDSGILTVTLPKADTARVVKVSLNGNTPEIAEPTGES
jgi:HSP20 family protein